MLTEGSPAPDFSLPDQNGAPHTLAQYRGQWVLLYFYPKDDTPGCTAEACGFRDAFTEVRKAGCVVLGVSADTPESHGKFAAKHKLPFALLADPARTTIAAYGAARGGLLDALAKRISYLIDPEGNVAKAYPSVSAATHAHDVLGDLDRLTE